MVRQIRTGNQEHNIEMMSKRFYIMAAALVCLAASCTQEQAGKTVYLKDYLTGDMLCEDAEPAIRKALEECLCSKGSTLVLPGGTLPVKPDFCYGKYQRISNNDPSDKRIAFDIVGADGLTVEGNGTTLLFTGFVSPFNIEDSRDVTIRGLNIDYTRTFHSEGLITDSGKDWVKVRFPEDYKVSLESGIIVFKDEFRNEYPYGNLLEFDSYRKEVAHYVRDYWVWGPGLQAEALPDGDYKVFEKDIKVTKGNVLVFGAAARLNPAFTLERCDGFTLKDVNIWHCGGMGVIAQRSKDVELNNVDVVPSPGKGRMISITADATHFVNCKGSIRMIGCTFMNQKDDATNIHGWYSVARKKVSDNQLLLWSNYGKDFAEAGMEMELVSHSTMMTYDTLKVENVEKYNDFLSLVTFTESVPEAFEEKDVLADVSVKPDVLIQGCTFGNNRARGLLIGSKGKVIIENNRFHVPGAAILFEGDGNYWYEQSGVKDVTIRGNKFENCLYGSKGWGRAYIAVGSGIPQRETSRYHSNITVEGNTFNTFDPRILNLYCVDGITYRNNEVILNNDYEYDPQGEPFEIKYCDNVNVQK